ncbi:hydrogenase maturation nickel metallochaperone HypA [Nonomuraea sp. NPDC049750]|uniref:hydrogenase maturation nickel metallochaperone HypA n=1 Tax=Nonomuraea sp. NPDC049750 TaxID=3154738 RepID=UPI0033D25A28
MHELGMCEGLVDLVRQQADGRRVTGLRVRIGARHAVVGEAFDHAFALAAEGSAAEGAALDLVVTPVTVDCGACGHQSESVDVLAVCARCGDDDVDVRGGDELVLESVQFKDGSALESDRFEEEADVPRDPR